MNKFINGISNYDYLNYMCDYRIYINVSSTKTISKPIKYISNVTKEVSKGNFDISIDYESEDEIGTLFKNFNLMIVELKNMEYLR